MIKTFTSLVFFLLTLTHSHAQTHTLELNKVSMPDLQRWFYIDKVIDCRIVKNSIGEVQRSILNNKASAVFPKPLDQELQGFISAHHPKQENQLPIILRVNKFWVSEFTTSNSESATAELRVDFIYKQDSIYHKLYSTTLTTTSYGIEVTHKHDENIAKVMYGSIKQLASRNLDTMIPEAEKLTSDQVTAVYDNSIVLQNYPILQESAYARGIYISLDEFRNNKPGITSGYEIKQRSNFDKVMVGGGDVVPVLSFSEGKNKTVTNAWGFSDGSNLYMNLNGGYYQLQLKNGEFAFIGPPAKSGNAATTAGIIGAAGGGAIVGAIAGGVAGVIEASTAEPTIYTLDLETGMLLVDGTPLGMDNAEAKLIVYREAKGERSEPVNLIINGEATTLTTNQTLEYDLNTRNAGTSICLEGNEPCINFMPTPGKTYYISCKLGTKSTNGKPELKEELQAQGEYAVKGIKFYHIKLEKEKNKKEGKK